MESLRIDAAEGVQYITGARKRNGLPLSGAEAAWPLCVCEEYVLFL